MMFNTGFLLLFMFIASPEAFLIPEYKELIYDYHAKVIVGSNIPGVSESGYEIFAEVHVRNYEYNNILLELKDVSYSPHTGEESEEPTKRIKAPKEADAITLPYFFTNQPTDLSRIIIIGHRNDSKWSIDMKRAIANLFALDEPTILDEKFASEAMEVSEDSIYGAIVSRYTHQSSHEGHMVFTKDSEEGRYFLRNYHSTVHHSDDGCKSGDYSYYSIPKSFTHRKYDIAMNGNDSHIYSVQSENSVSFSYNKDNYFGTTSHVLKFKAIRDMVDKNLEFVGKNAETLHFENKYGKDKNDLTGGRRDRDPVSIKDKVKSIFFSVLDRVGNIKLNTSHLESDDRENIIVLIEEMRNLEENSLCELYTEILQNDKKQIETYALFLALTGTTESLSAIKKLIDEKVMDQDTAVKALHEVSSNAVPNVLSIEKLMELVDDKAAYEKPIKEAAVLAMTRMIKGMSIKYLRDDNDFSKYVSYFVNKFEKAKDYDEQLLCMTAFINMQIKEVTRYLEKIVKNEKAFKLSGHIRSLAILGIVHHDTNTWNFIETRRISELLFPMFKNSNEDTEVRVTALRYIIKYGSDEDLVSLFWHMNTEKDQTFLDMFHTAVQSYSGSFSDCYRGKLKYFKDLYKYMPKLKSERKSDSSEYIMDYFDKLNGFGSLLKVSSHANNDGFTSEYFQYTWKFGKSVYDQYSIYLYVKQNTPNLTKIRTLSNILALAVNDAKIEIILFRYNLIVKVIKTTPEEILKSIGQLKRFMFDYSLTYALDQSLDQEVVVNSDVGVPVSFYTKKPSITLIQAVTDSNSLSNLRLSRWSHGEYGLKVYNPIADTWHGVQRVQTGEVNMYMDVEVISWNWILWNVINANNSPLGFKSVVRVAAFTDDGKSKISTSVDNEELEEDYTFWSVDDENTRLLYNFKIFDCTFEDRITLVNQIKQKFLLSSYKNPYDLPVMNLYLTGQYIWDYFSVFPSTSSCGVLMKVEKSPNYDMTRIEMINVFPRQHDLELIIQMMHKNDCVNKFKIIREKFSKKNGNISLILKLENLKSEINPNNENYILQLNRESFVLSDELHSNFLITNGKNVNEMNNVINVTVNGKLSKEQGHDMNREYKIYKKCLDEMFNSMDKCVKKISSLRSYQFDISYDESNSKLNAIWNYLIDFLRNAYSDRFERITNTDEIHNGHVKLLVNYPILPEEVVDLSILSTHESFTVKNIPFADFLYKEAVEPLSTYSDSSSDYQSYCEFTIDGVNKADAPDLAKTVLPTKWTRMTGDCKNDSCSWELDAKKLDESSDLMALRILFEDEIVDVHIDKVIEIYVNDKLLDTSSDLRQYNTKWIDVMVFKVDGLVLIHMKNVPVNIQFNGRLGKISSQFIYGDGVCHN